MCFIKGLPNVIPPHFTPTHLGHCGNPNCDQQYCLMPSNSQINFIVDPFFAYQQQSQASLLAELYGRCQNNQQMTFVAKQRLKQSINWIKAVEEEVDDLRQHIELGPKLESDEAAYDEGDADGLLWKSGMVREIFGGQKVYKYKLKLSQNFPQIIYKQRNLSIAIQLTDLRTHSVSNSNLINLCIGVCDHQGEWQQYEGSNFIGGRTEVDLFRGTANFIKIYPKDVTRCFEGRKLNLLIYARTSIITYSDDLSKNIVDSDLIEPLLIEGITVKAKKKKETQSKKRWPTV